ncbi:MAG: helix-turn-helix domain-containing protein [Pseudobacteriovorax sp.]|nr:helix-turn-helix domain-containing protein [Pseudobacteriovorax sp.]
MKVFGSIAEMIRSKINDHKKETNQNSQEIAKAIGISTGMLSQILSGKRKVSREVSHKLQDLLNLSAKDFQIQEVLVELQFVEGPAKVDLLAKLKSFEQVRGKERRPQFRSWADFKEGIIPFEDAEDALSNIDKASKAVISMRDYYSCSDQVWHQFDSKILNMAAQAVGEQSTETRYSSNSTFACRREQIPEIEKLLEEGLNHIISLLQQGESKTTAVLSSHLFRLSHQEET